MTLTLVATIFGRKTIELLREFGNDVDALVHELLNSKDDEDAQPKMTELYYEPFEPDE